MAGVTVQIELFPRTTVAGLQIIVPLPVDEKLMVYWGGPIVVTLKVSLTPPMVSVAFVVVENEADEV
jgi:hypothetical protein